jgi:hypothetical protein
MAFHLASDIVQLSPGRDLHEKTNPHNDDFGRRFRHCGRYGTVDLGILAVVRSSCSGKVNVSPDVRCGCSQVSAFRTCTRGKGLSAEDWV